MGLGLNLSFAAALLLSFTGTALADVVELKNGQRVEGALKQATPASVSIEVGGQTITFKAAQVRAIYYGSAPVQARTDSSPGAEAVRALKDLRSAVASGVTYRDYGPRVADAKIKVDRFLERATTGQASTAIQRATTNYQLANSTWSAKIQLNGSIPLSVIQPLADAGACKEVSAAVADLHTRGYAPGSLIPDDVAEGLVPMLWQCASRDIAEAEKAMKP